MTPTFTSACAAAAQAALNNNVDTAFLKSMTFSEELQRCKRLMASRPDHDVVRVRPKVRPRFSYRTAAAPQVCYRAIRCRSTMSDRSKAKEGKGKEIACQKFFQCMAESRYCDA